MEIKVQQLKYNYSKKMSPALDGIHIRFSSGKITGIMGPTGSGKSTLLDVIASLKQPTSGKVIVDNYIITRLSLKEDLTSYQTLIGYVPQYPNGDFLQDTVEKEISSWLEKYNYNSRKRHQHILQSLEMVGLDESYLKKAPFSLSNGEARLVSLARSLSYNPKILLLDEPTVGLDDMGKKKLITILTTIKTRYQKTVLIASSDIDFLNKISDEMVVLKDGKVLLSGNKKDVLKETELFDIEKIALPRITQFESYVLKEKSILLGHRSEVNDLVKDILRKKS